jgi:hypothetical protein
MPSAENMPRESFLIRRFGGRAKAVSISMASSRLQFG